MTTKLIATLFISLTFTTLSVGQTASTTGKYIEVSGSAKVDLAPNRLYFSFTASEYQNGSRSISLRELEGNIKALMQNLRMDKRGLIPGSIWNKHYEIKKKGKPHKKSQDYILKLDNTKLLDTLLTELLDLGIQNLKLDQASHNKLVDYKKKVKVDAIKNAKSKAKILLESIGEEIGSVISVQEMENSNSLQSSIESSDDNFYAINKGVKSIYLPRIEISYSVLVRFRIK